jgi:hypothetical protein
MSIGCRANRLNAALAGLPTNSAAGLSLAITGTNYYLLRFENKWARFQPEFQGYSAVARILGGLAIAVVVMGIAIAAIASATAVGHLRDPTAIVQPDS